MSHRADRQHKNRLLALVGLGESNRETDVSERAEEILAAEIDPIRGWSLRFLTRDTKRMRPPGTLEVVGIR